MPAYYPFARKWNIVSCRAPLCGREQQYLPPIDGFQERSVKDVLTERMTLYLLRSEEALNPAIRRNRAGGPDHEVDPVECWVRKRMIDPPVGAARLGPV